MAAKSHINLACRLKDKSIKRTMITTTFAKREKDAKCDIRT